MDEELIKINLTLTKYQRLKIINAFTNLRDIRMRLSRNKNFRGSDTLIIPTKLFKKLDNNSNGKELHLKYSLYDELHISSKISVLLNIANLSKDL